MVGARVLAEDEDRVGVFEIFQRDRALADADLRPHALPLGSWHMLEQSGKLFVPYSRTNSW